MLDLNTTCLSFFTIILSLTSIFYFLFLLLSDHPTKNPCPESYPIIGNLPGLLRNRHRFHDWVSDILSQTPSSTLQVNFFLNLSRGICTANPLNIDHLLHSNFNNYIKGSRFSDVLQELLGDGIFNVDGHLWTLQRKIASHEFSTKSLNHFISDVVNSQISDRLIPFLSHACNVNEVIDLQEVLQDFTYRNISTVAFGVVVDPAYKSSNAGFFKAFDDAVEICSSRFLSPLPVIWKMKRYFNIGSEKRFKKAIQVINNYALEIIMFKEKEESNTKEEEEGSETRNQDLLSRFMQSTSTNMEFRDEEHKRKFLRDIIISFVMAGKDSTSTALTWFFWLIAGNPRCTELLLAELNASTSLLHYHELKKFHYLHAALSESMRLFPPVPINSRLTVDDDVLPDGTHVGKGWFADYSAYATGRTEKVWGLDCREFKPERWLNGDGLLQPPDHFRFPVFHCGPRMCLVND
ncbi:p450 domain-containing protein [Cephalotus follicularis]|uniref:p450 domain-containing protein n=1 Tax=Cephalotus follicularis TaxID=3775 RepID=A0A1Q3B2T8_CEPFO|nr:p450 domain-containing protein [Cephalotus follicularis]